MRRTGGNVLPHAKLSSCTGARTSPLSAQARGGFPRCCWRRWFPSSHPGSASVCSPSSHCWLLLRDLCLLSPPTTSALSHIAPGLRIDRSHVPWLEVTTDPFLRLPVNWPVREGQGIRTLGGLKKGGKKKKKKNSRGKTSMFSKALKQPERSCKRQKDQTKKGKR